MKIILAPNAFKECLSAPKAAAAMAKGINAVLPQAEIREIPLADGGDGTMEALVSARNGEIVSIQSSDPLQRKIPVQYGLIDNGQTAVIEMALASGLWLLSDSEKNPLKTTTLGTGEMIVDAIERGVTSIILGIGGSATTDAGIGMAEALGYRFYDAQNEPVAPIGESMSKIKRIDCSDVHSQLKNVKIYVASDVTNPLLGPDGAAPVYGPQKGATPEMVQILEQGLQTVSNCWVSDMNVTIGDLPGGGAAGGLGAGLVAFCGAEIRSGFDLIAEYADLDHHLKGADLAITGEGKIDASTRFGKVPAGVLRKANAVHVPVIAIAGQLSGDVESLNREGMLALFSIANGPLTVQESMDNAAELISQVCGQIIRVYKGRS
jgi:glycerate kinase